jgi:hypothetical protein
MPPERLPALYQPLKLFGSNHYFLALKKYAKLKKNTLGIHKAINPLSMMN